MKNLLGIGVLVAFAVLGACRQNQSGMSYPQTPAPAIPSSTSVVPTKSNVQPLVDQLASKYKGAGCSQEPCRAEVVNVREIPAQNQAVATIQFDSFVYKRTGRVEEYIYSGEGKAILEKSTEGTWSMTSLELTKYGEGWKWSEMRGYDVR